jgi:hypothetical protein
MVICELELHAGIFPVRRRRVDRAQFRG